MIGTIVELDSDGLGWIHLDDGARIRFGASAVRGIPRLRMVGARVRVLATAPGFRGVIKATTVEPLDPLQPNPAFPADPPPPAPLGPSELAASHPRWSDVGDVSLVPALDVAGSARPPPPWFAPWHDEIRRTTPIVVGLRVPSYRAPDPIEPAAADAFSHGHTAFLETPAWPACGKCGALLEMCIQLPASILAAWAPGRGGLVVMFCFPCGAASSHDPAVSFARFVQPLHRVTRSAPATSASSTSPRASQRVTAGAPHRLLPSGAWYRFRAERVTDTASARIYGDSATYQDVVEDFEAWSEGLSGPSWGGARLGGAPEWDQRDETPDCAHGSMRLLLEYEGEQFLDGSLKVFICTAGCPDVRVTAEL